MKNKISYFTFALLLLSGCEELAVYHVSEVRLNEKSLTLSIGEDAILEAIVLPCNANDKTVFWKSSAPEVVELYVSGGGYCHVEAISPGQATITVTTNEGGKKAEVSITVGALTDLLAIEMVKARYFTNFVTA